MTCGSSRSTWGVAVRQVGSSLTSGTRLSDLDGSNRYLVTSAGMGVMIAEPRNSFRKVAKSCGTDDLITFMLSITWRRFSFFVRVAYCNEGSV